MKEIETAIIEVASFGFQNDCQKVRQESFPGWLNIVMVSNSTQVHRFGARNT